MTQRTGPKLQNSVPSYTVYYFFGLYNKIGVIETLLLGTGEKPTSNRLVTCGDGFLYPLPPSSVNKVPGPTTDKTKSSSLEKKRRNHEIIKERPSKSLYSVLL